MTQIHDRLGISHQVQHTYFANCSCGWVGPARDVENVAAVDWNLHWNEHLDIRSSEASSG